MFKVDRHIFKDYIKRNSLKPKQGQYFHELVYCNEHNNIKAREESSSWSGEELYFIADNTYENYETLEIITNIINRK